MTKIEQVHANGAVEAELFRFLNNVALQHTKTEDLHYCKAHVNEYVDVLTGEVTLELISYNTSVAIIKGATCYDFLRKVYGYTATSAQHIAKFMRKYGVSDKKTWYYIWPQHMETAKRSPSVG